MVKTAARAQLHTRTRPAAALRLATAVGANQVATGANRAQLGASQAAGAAAGTRRERRGSKRGERSDEEEMDMTQPPAKR
jgi:hypothetical protein